MKLTMLFTARVGVLGFAGFVGFGMVYAQNALPKTVQNIVQFATKNIANEKIKITAIVHFVERGDTLWMVSERYYGRALLWTDISYDNNVPEPKRLQPGTMLLLRAGGLGSANSASVIAVSGDVRRLTPVVNVAKTGNTANTARILMAGKLNGKSTNAPQVTYVAGDLINKGDTVPVGTSLKTGGDSFITLLMPNGSRATMPSNSQIKLVSLKDAKGMDAVLLDLEVGQIDARVPYSDDASITPSYRIRTKVATLGARGTYFRVVLPDANTQRTLVGVLEGTVAANWGAEKSLSDNINNDPQASKSSAALLTVGQGAILQLGMSAKPAAVHKLLSAPVFQEANAPQNQSDIVVRWLPVAGAAAYRVQLAKDAYFYDVFAQQDVPAQRDLKPAVGVNSSDDAYKTWFSKVAQGSYYVRVSAIAADGLEGLFALSTFTRLSYRVTGKVALSANQEQLEFSWTALPSGKYWLEVADNKAFAGVLLNVPHLRSNTVRVAALPPGNYFWRVRADVQEHGQSTTVMSDVMPMLVGGAR